MKKLWIAAALFLLAGIWEFYSAIFAAWASATPVENIAHYQGLAMNRLYAGLGLLAVAVLLAGIAVWRKRHT